MFTFKVIDSKDLDENKKPHREPIFGLKRYKNVEIMKN